MNELILLLVFALTLLVSDQAAQVATVEGAAHPDIDTKPSLRGLKSTEVTEERGMTELFEKIKAWLQRAKKWIASSKTVQGAKDDVRALAQKRRAATASNLVKKDATNDMLLKNKVTPDEYFLAKGLNSKVKDFSDVPEVLEKNPGLKEWVAYVKYWDEMAYKAPV
uniref:Avh251 n=1 Tax=Phytophthora sojae TaxID=67593 RepID=E0W5B7_PHYSO|nr:Avh251 [Phytophthora sojae]AEK81035.1 Avh251 [Phytophthora sojae]AEK81036.1 Avh251 [Phytophthora sojae]